MSNVTLTQENLYSEIYRAIRSGSVREMASITSEVKATVAAKLPAEQRGAFQTMDVGAVNTIVRVAKSLSEAEFLRFVEDPESVAIKLSPAEMEFLKGGRVPWQCWLAGGLSLLGCAASLGAAGELCAAAVVVCYDQCQ